MIAEGFSEAQLSFKRALDLSYVGQSHELTVTYSPDQVQSVADSFHAAHERRYGYRQEGAAVEVVTVRLTVSGPATTLELPRTAPVESGAPAATTGKKTVWFGGKGMETALYERESLSAGDWFEGPAIVFQYDSATVVPPRWRAVVHETGSLILTQQLEKGEDSEGSTLQ